MSPSKITRMDAASMAFRLSDQYPMVRGDIFGSVIFGPKPLPNYRDPALPIQSLRLREEECVDSR